MWQFAQIRQNAQNDILPKYFRVFLSMDVPQSDGANAPDFTNKILRKMIFQKFYKVQAPQFKFASVAPGHNSDVLW